MFKTIETSAAGAEEGAEGRICGLSNSVLRGEAPPVREAASGHPVPAHSAGLIPAGPAGARSNSPVPPNRRQLETEMLDDQTLTREAERLVEVADYIELGRLVADWSRSPDSRPVSIAQLASQLDGVARVPGSFKRVRFVESEPDVLTIRLPDPQLLDEAMLKMETHLVGERYMLPNFYDDIYRNRFGPVMSPLDTFFARIGDYTISQCV